MCSMSQYLGSERPGRLGQLREFGIRAEILLTFSSKKTTAKLEYLSSIMTFLAFKETI